MKTITKFLLGCLVLSAASCAPEPFWLGADISGSTGQEARGEYYYDSEGNGPKEITALMKEMGVNAVRFRVWVQPRRWGRPGQPVDSTDNRGLCNKEDVLQNCLIAKKLGMQIMIDFHYSDTWADPGHQPIPRSWMGHSYGQMKEDLKAHTVETLQLLKDNGIKVKWVQVGNETTNGLLWNNQGQEVTEHMGHSKLDPEQYAGFLDAGYEAVKSVYPKAICIVHLDNGFDQELYDWNLGILEKCGTRYDMVGMSLYPYWAARSGHPDADKVIADCAANIAHVYERFGKESMIVETGAEVVLDDPARMQESVRQMQSIVEMARNTEHCHGLFYWNPCCRPRGYMLGAFDMEGKPTGIMDAFVAK
ncbi:MAG: arabinogalactan endo-1,4-beta-galactosidase [Bacteroidales bacterium]|nr:arabinogalactan endo-1,4-beta-galactosidase [Bacteroidales bacterium]